MVLELFWLSQLGRRPSKLGRCDELLDLKLEPPVRVELEPQPCPASVQLARFERMPPPPLGAKATREARAARVRRPPPIF